MSDPIRHTQGGKDPDQHPSPPKSGLSPSTSSRLREDAAARQAGQGGLGAFWAELKRRKVMRVAITYAVVAWLIIQIAEATFENFGIPVWAFRFVTLMVLLGFPIALILAWAFELTPEGIKTTKTAVAERGDASVSETQQRKRNWTAYAVGAILPSVIFGALAVYFYATRSSSPDSELSALNSSLAQPDKSIAVLPLENMSPDPDNAFFADGVQEEIVTNLSKINDLVVIGRTSTLRYRGTTKSPKQIGEEMNVKFLLDGSVQRAEDQVRVTVQLIDTSTESHLWSERYTERLDDFFGIITSISKDIAGELQAVLSPQEIAEIERSPTENPMAYDMFLQGSDFRLDWEKRLDLLGAAVALDPDFFQAWHLYAITSSMAYSGSGRNDPDLLAKAKRAIDEVKRTAPNLSWYYHALAVLAFNETSELANSTELLVKALSENPQNHEAQGTLALRYMESGRISEALPYLEAAIQEDPFSGAITGRLLFCYERLGMYEKARSLLKWRIEQEEESNFWSVLLATVDYIESGDRESYIQALVTRGANESVKGRMAAINRDLKNALIHIDDWNALSTESTLYLLPRFIYQWRFSIWPKELMASLLWFELGNEQESRRFAEMAEDKIEQKLRDPFADPLYTLVMAIVQALSGERAQTEATLANLRERTASPNWKYRREVPCEMGAAIAYLVLGDHDKAIETLEAASKMDGPIFLARELDLWFIFDRLRGDPRFEALLED